jgi:hypothetical protein
MSFVCDGLTNGRAALLYPSAQLTICKGARYGF